MNRRVLIVDDKTGLDVAAASQVDLVLLNAEWPGIDGVLVVGRPTGGLNVSQASAPNPLRAPVPRADIDLSATSSWVGPWRA
jgi:hypothetical protein